jgi:hypothetical protein
MAADCVVLSLRRKAQIRAKAFERSLGSLENPTGPNQNILEDVHMTALWVACVFNKYAHTADVAVSQPISVDIDEDVETSEKERYVTAQAKVEQRLSKGM